jgi:2-oxoglutarate dehydrogenase E1 component
LGVKFGPTKRFGLEGGETTIAGLDAILNFGAESQVEEVAIGMAHRGRLNVLCNILGKTYEDIFNEFEGAKMPEQTYGSGDVKYHMGYSSQVTTMSGKKLHLKLLPNPSHLEAVDPVMEGFARAKADILYKSDYNKILPIMIHGDASVAGQGIVYEVLQMSQLEGYNVGGTIHFVINNQVGFTTDFDDARSSTYCTSIANTIQAPTFHVNGDDAEAVIYCCELATAYRQKFHKDVFIDMVCYRKNGHNESDAPEVTQPELYKIIKNKKNPREVYTEILLGRNEIDRELATKMSDAFKADLQDRFNSVKQNPLPYKYQEPEEAWRLMKKAPDASDFEKSPATGIKTALITDLIAKLQAVPAGYTPPTPIARAMKKQEKLLSEGKIDWALGELLAYSSILSQGNDVRLSGEDVKRGTFAHRNVVYFWSEDNAQGIPVKKQYNRLAQLSPSQGKFRVYNSLLSEYAVLGFEYGYAMANPNSLVIWEGQFGDFVNGAQTIIDQFIAAGESKWLRQNGIVLLLPHGFEGQGPEHSSARMERFLQSCAEFNMTVANISTPANLFHAMRRQLERPFRKPMIIMSPKSLLKEDLCVSQLSELEPQNGFQEVIDDSAAAKNAAKVTKVLFCTGKVYYDLLKRQIEHPRADIAIVRIEQLYPFPETKVKGILNQYANAKAYWVQEEPLNMGAWMHIASNHSDLGLGYIGRKASASPATGFMSIHIKEQTAIIDRAFG